MEGIYGMKQYSEYKMPYKQCEFIQKVHIYFSDVMISQYNTCICVWLLLEARDVKPNQKIYFLWNLSSL